MCVLGLISDFEVPTIANLLTQGILRQPPTTNMDRFKYYIESFHYPVHVSREPTMFRVDVRRNIEWHIQLRHFFVDLDQQLQELEHFLSSSSSSANKDNMDDNANRTDTAALANWTSYEIPTFELGPAICFHIERTDLERFTNLRCAQRKMFSQRSAKGDGKQLTGRWLVVAYVFASTPEAMFNMDVKTLLSTGCSGTVTAAHGTGSCSGAGASTHYNTDTMLALRAQSWDPHNCIRGGDGPATGTFYQLERRKKLTSKFYIYRYGGGGGITTSTTTTSMTSTPTVVEIEDKAVDTTITSTTTTTKKTDIVEGTETGNAEDETEMVPTVYYDPYLRRCRPGETNIDAVPIGVPIPQEPEDRCHLIDRLWPALMTGQYIVPPQATTDPDDLVWDWTDEWPNTSTK